MRVVSVGSVNADLVTRLPQLPVRGETQGGGRSHVDLGGKGANKAAAAAALGVESHLIACVGDDHHGQASVDDLRSRGSRLHLRLSRPDTDRNRDYLGRRVG